MGKLSFSLSVLVALSLCAHEIAASRMVAQKVSEKRQQGRAFLTEQQQQFRKAAQAAEASMVCGKPEIKDAINEDKSAEGVADIEWLSIQKTAEAGLDTIEKRIETLTLDVEELEQRIKELEEAGKWGELPDAAMDEMLHAACQVDDLKNDDGDCGRAVEFKCGYDDYEMLEARDWVVPFDEPVAAFKAMAEKKFADYKRLSANRFRKYCSEKLPGSECGFLCDAFVKIVKSSASKKSSVVMGETDTLDEVKANHKEKSHELERAKADKEECVRAQVQINDFAAELGELSATYSDNKLAVGEYTRSLRRQSMRLAYQIKVLEQKKVELAKAKTIFAAASAQVEARQADVAEMEAVLERLQQALQKQLALIRALEQRIADIEDATEIGRLFKIELSLTMAKTVEYNAESVHKPLALLGVTPDRSILQEFDAAEVAAAPAMKQTVRAVGEYCRSEKVVSALTSPLVELKGTSHQLNFICTGQNWDKMILEAQEVVKQDAKKVADILLVEQSSVVADITIPAESSLKFKKAMGEPDGLRQTTAVYGGQTGTFVNSYLSPGWKVESKNGEEVEVGKMLTLYQKLGEAFELTTANWEEAKEGAKQLDLQIEAALKEMVKLRALLQRAIAAKEVAEDKMNLAQELVNQAEATKTQLEGVVASAKDKLAQGEEAFETTKDALLKEHRERSAALLEVLQELGGR